MKKIVNKLEQYTLTAEKGMTLTNGEIYTKIYISNEVVDTANWVEVEDSAVPVNDEITDTEALKILLGGAV